jgi:hypothetical protein
MTRNHTGWMRLCAMLFACPHPCTTARTWHGPHGSSAHPDGSLGRYYPYAGVCDPTTPPIGHSFSAIYPMQATTLTRPTPAATPGVISIRVNDLISFRRGIVRPIGGGGDPATRLHGRAWMPMAPTQLSVCPCIGPLCCCVANIGVKCIISAPQDLTRPREAVPNSTYALEGTRTTPCGHSV